MFESLPDNLVEEAPFDMQPSTMEIVCDGFRRAADWVRSAWSTEDTDTTEVLEQYQYPDYTGHNLNLLSVSGAEPLIPYYQAALALSEHVAYTEIRPIEPGVRVWPRARPFPTEGHNIIFLPLGGSQSDEFIANLAGQPFTLESLAEKIGVHPANLEKDRDLFLAFAMLHELGHTVQFSEEQDNFSRLDADIDDALNSLPVPGVSAGRLMSNDAQIYITDHWAQLKAQHGINTREELYELQRQKYRQMFHEAYADSFAVTAMGMRSAESQEA